MAVLVLRVVTQNLWGDRGDWPGGREVPFRRLDYVFVRCGLHGGPTLAITRCERAFDRPVGGVWGSDHYGVVADVEMP